MFSVTAEAPVTEYESVQCIRIKLNDTPNAKIGIHFDMLADKIGKTAITGFTKKYVTDFSSMISILQQLLITNT